jgi:hypothetical protein
MKAEMEPAIRTAKESAPLAALSLLCLVII